LAFSQHNHPHGLTRQHSAVQLLSGDEIDMPLIEVDPARQSVKNSSLKVVHVLAMGSHFSITSPNFSENLAMGSYVIFEKLPSRFLLSLNLSHIDALKYIHTPGIVYRDPRIAIASLSRLASTWLCVILKATDLMRSALLEVTADTSSRPPLACPGSRREGPSH
jgi:hypothetical protein